MPQLVSRSLGFPPEVIASWPIPNYTNPVTRGPELFIINGIWLFVATVCVGARLYTRISIRNWIGLDDAFIVIAIIAAYGVAVCVLLGYHKFDWDRHIWDTPLQHVTASGKLLYSSRILWAIASTSVRFSVVALYYRLLDHIGLRKWRWVLHVNSAFMALLFLAQEFTSILSCIPPAAMWTWPQMTSAKCLNNGISEIAGAILNTISEFIVACLPIPMVASLQMSRGQRYSVISLLSLGFLVVACGCVRTYYIWMSVVTYDPSWYAGPHWICSEVEIDTAMICACAPALKPMLSRLVHRGPAAVRKPNLNESGHHSGSESNQRARSLFSKKISDSDDQLNSFGTDSSSHLYKTVDLEGIANDGFGYTVTITGGAETGVKKRRFKLTKRRNSSEESLEQEKSAIQVPRRIMSRGSGRRNKANEILDIDDKYDTDIITRKSFEFRESYHEDDERRWDLRNPYRAKLSEKDIERGEDIATTGGAEWAHRGHNPKRKNTPELGKKDSKASLDIHRQHSITNSSIRRHNSGSDRMSSRRFISQELEQDYGRPITSPHIASAQQNMFPRVVQAQRMNTPSPPPNHFGGRVSPVVQPLNSSQWWATSSRPPSVRQVRTPVSAIFANPVTVPRLDVEESTWSGPLEAVIASAWKEGRAASYNSSLSVKNGSKSSLTVEPESIEIGNASVYQESVDEESFSLPIEKPPSWPAGLTWERVRPGTANLPRTTMIPISWVGTRPGTAM